MSRAARWLAVVVAAVAALCVWLLTSTDVGVDDPAAPETAPRPAETSRSVTVPRGEPPRVRQRVAAVSETTDETPPPRDGVFIIHVTSAEDGAAIAGASVSVTDSYNRVTEWTTGADGDARVTDIAQGRAEIVARAPGRLRDHVRSEAGDAPLRVDVTLRAGVAVEIEVRDARSDRPVAGALVVLDRRVGPDRDEVSTDSRGRATACLPADAGAIVTTTALGYFESVDFVRAGPDGAAPATLRVELARAGSVSGVVRDPDGNPVEGADVRVRREAAREPPLGVESDEDGSYRVDDLVPGARYAARVTHHQFASSVETTGLAPTADRPDLQADLRLRRPASLTIEVADEDGQSVTAFTEFVRRMVPIAYLRRRGIAGERDAVDPGHYVVHAWVSGGLGATAEIDLAEGEERTVKLRIGRAVAIAGVVVDAEGEPIEQVRVGLPLIVGSSRQDQPMAYTNAEGRFEIGPLSKGAHDVVFDAKFGRGEAFESLVLPGVAAPTDSLRIVLPSRGRLTLRILFDEAARPSGGMVEINGPAGEARWNTGAPLRADGKVDVGLPSDVAGDVSIGVRGFESVRRRVVASSGANVDLGDVRLRRGATLAGVLRAYDGRPAPNVEVLADVSSSKRSVKTDASGAFQIDGLPSGTVRVESPAGPWGPATAFRVGLPLTEDLVLALPRPGLLSMVLLDRSGAPRPRGAVVFRDAGGEPMSVGSDRADERGRFEASLGPGVYTVEADGFPAETVEVREDDVTFLRLREP